MATQKILMNGNEVELDKGDSLGYRLQRFIQNSANFAQKGGDFSTTLTFPLTKTNKRAFGITYHTSGINKFNRTAHFIAEIYIDGVRVFVGIFKVTKISSKGYEGEFRSQKISWIELMDNKTLNKLGYVDNQATWTTPFDGGDTINTANELPNSQTDVLFPTIVYNNSPVTDYLGFTDVEIFGSYDGGGNQITPPLDFPNDFKLINAYFSDREGLTFEDFPPAVYYSNLLRKCFEEVGWVINGEIFNQEWFNKLYMPYVGSGYKWNWANLAELHVEPDTRTTPAYNGLTITTDSELAFSRIPTYSKRDLEISSIIGEANPKPKPAKPPPRKPEPA